MKLSPASAPLLERMMTLDELIARLEKATAPDRGLDRDIAFSFGWDPDGIQEPPAYTASIDAAMTLVPAGMHWQLNSAGAPNSAWQAAVCRSDLEPQVECWAYSSPAIALCIAALRARNTGETE